MTTASIVGSPITTAASSATATPGNRRCSCLSRSPSRSTTVFTTLAGGLSKLRIRFGPQCPAPMTAVRIGSPGSNRPEILHCLSKIRADGGAGLAGALIGLDQREADVAFATGAEADAGRYGDPGLSSSSAAKVTEPWPILTARAGSG